MAGRTGPTDALGELWRYDGATWTMAPVPARFLIRIGDRLIRGWGNQISQCSADPMVAENWTGGTPAGDASDVISGLGAVNSVLFIFARTGRVFTLNGDGTHNDLYPGLRRTPALDPLDAPGGQVASWLNALWFRNGDGFYRLEASGGTQIEDVGPGRLVDNGSVVSGPVQCFAGHQDWYAFQGVYNPATDASYLLQYGDWLPQGAGEDAAYRFLDTLHGALVVWEGKRVTALQATIGGFAGGEHTRVYAGFSDGTMGWFNLPRSGPNPFATDAGLDEDDFTADPSYLTWPLHTLLASADRKEYLSVTAHGPRITPGDFVRVSYWLDPVLLPQTEVLRRNELARTAAGPGAFLAQSPRATTREAPVLGVQYTFPQDVTAAGAAAGLPGRHLRLRDRAAGGVPHRPVGHLRRLRHARGERPGPQRAPAPQAAPGVEPAADGGEPDREAGRGPGAQDRRPAPGGLLRRGRDPKTTILEMPDEVVRGFQCRELRSRPWRRSGSGTARSTWWISSWWSSAPSRHSAPSTGSSRSPSTAWLGATSTT